MNNQNELISVVIPTYNREKTIEKAIRSVLTQTYSRIEVIIVDDGSTDNTKKIIDTILDSRIRYIYQDNQGACVARNTGILKSKGEYVAFHDSDDIWRKNKLEKQLQIFNLFSPDIVFCKLVSRGLNGEEVLLNNLKEGFISLGDDLVGIGTQTIIAKREVFKEVLFDNKLPRFQDYEFLLCALERDVKIYCLAEGLVDYFVGEDSISRNSEMMFIASKIILDKHMITYKNEPSLGKGMAILLISAAKEMCYCSKDYRYKEFIYLAHKYDKSLKTTFFFLLTKIGAFPLLYRIKKMLK